MGLEDIEINNEAIHKLRRSYLGVLLKIILVGTILGFAENYIQEHTEKSIYRESKLLINSYNTNKNSTIGRSEFEATYINFLQDKF